MSLILPTGASVQLTATISSLNGAPTIDVTTSSFWASSDETVATVTQEGLVTAAGSGTFVQLEFVGSWVPGDGFAIREDTFPYATEYYLSYSVDQSNTPYWFEVPALPNFSSPITRLTMVKHPNMAPPAPNDPLATAISPMEDVDATIDDDWSTAASASIAVSDFGGFNGYSVSTPSELNGPFSVRFENAAGERYTMSASFYLTDVAWRIPS